MWKKTVVLALMLALLGNTGGLALAADQQPNANPLSKEGALKIYFEKAVSLRKEIVLEVSRQGGVTTSRKVMGWKIYEGNKRINPVRLAELAGDTELLNEMKARRQKLQLEALGSFGVAIASLVFLGSRMGDSAPDASGFVALGTAAGGTYFAWQLFAQSFNPQITPQTAQLLADKYNTKLRLQLDLTLQEVRSALK